MTENTTTATTQKKVPSEKPVEPWKLKPFQCEVDRATLRNVLALPNKTFHPYRSERRRGGGGSREAMFSVTKQGFALKMVDPAHVAMLQVDWRVKVTIPGKETDFLIDTPGVLAFLQASRAEKFRLYAENRREGEAKWAAPVLGLEETLAEGVLHNWETAIMDTSGVHRPKVPKLELPARVVIDTRMLAQWLRIVSKEVDHVALMTENGKVWLTAEGEKGQQFKLGTFKREGKERSKERSLFSLDYLKAFVETMAGGPTGRAPISKKLVLNFGTDYPVRITTPEEREKSEPKVDVSFLLAPRIES